MTLPAPTSRDDLRARLDRGWDWLRDNPAHVLADYYARLWLDLLAQYVAIEDERAISATGDDARGRDPPRFAR